MSKIIAKKYTKAISEDFTKDEIIELIKILNKISDAFKIEKFREIINSPLIFKDKKEDLILSFFDSDNEKFKNVIKILSQHSRLALIPEITNDLSNKISIMNNEFIGKIYTKQQIDELSIKKLEQLFSKKFNVNIKLQPQDVEFNGLKIEFEELGVEINFSIDRLKSKINEYILQAI